MKRVASLVGGLVMASGALAGCQDDGGAVSVNSSWRLWANSTQSFTLHSLSGADGYDGNTIECSSDGVNVSIIMLDKAKIIDENNDTVPDVPPGNPGRIEISARLNDPTSCFVNATERALGTNPPTPPSYRDNCSLSGGCQFNLTVSGGAMMGTVSCTDMVQQSGGDPLILGSADRSTPMQINLENCDT